MRGLLSRLDWSLLAFVALAGVWLAVPSSLFIREVSITVDGDRVTFTRELPWGEVPGVWASEITLADGATCSSGGWQPALYQQQEGNTVTYPLGGWARECVEAGPPFYLRTVRWVMLWGWLPLRPMVSITNVTGMPDMMPSVPLAPPPALRQP